MATLFISTRRFASLVRRAKLVDGVVSEVHKEIVHVARRGLLVRLGAETGQALLVDVGAQGHNAVYEYVDA